MSKNIFDLTGKVAVITGGNNGLGLGFARGIAKQGGEVVIWGRSAANNAAVKEQLEAFGGRVESREVDISSEQESRRAGRIPHFLRQSVDVLRLPGQAGLCGVQGGAWRHDSLLRRGTGKIRSSARTPSPPASSRRG